jgi:hypothetical protein
LEGAGIDQRSDVAQRVPELLVALAPDQGMTLVGGIEAQDHPDGR